MKHGLWPPGCDESAFGASPSLFCCFYVSSHFLSLLSQPRSLINCKWCAKASWLLQGFSHPWVKSSISTILSCSNWVGPPSALLFCTSLRSGPEQRLFTQHLEMPSVCFVSQAELWGNVLISAYERVEIHASFCADVWGFHEQNKVCWVATSGHTCPALSCFFKFAIWNKAGGWCNPNQSGFPGRIWRTQLPGHHSTCPGWGLPWGSPLQLSALPGEVVEFMVVTQQFGQNFLAPAVPYSTSLIVNSNYLFLRKWLNVLVLVI